MLGGQSSVRINPPPPFSLIFFFVGMVISRGAIHRLVQLEIQSFAATLEGNTNEIFPDTGMSLTHIPDHYGEEHLLVEDATKILPTLIVLCIPNFLHLDVRHRMYFE